ncbi:predicted protein [Uncinocarpus reesii 1704]|uniref:Uncharacterized protein n=1 Tax=Uncinocarpus reesii (strain UAMH 1704) TaxID=336963 RepID=C4JUC3_UNCRE|nr:uncharacterized protein UREG_06062 [Uncinocarpus reesii 1704]EEP81220.1 predicted protein [Uncinocarpus reesii 1704]
MSAPAERFHGTSSVGGWSFIGLQACGSFSDGTKVSKEMRPSPSIPRSRNDPEFCPQEWKRIQPMDQLTIPVAQRHDPLELPPVAAVDSLLWHYSDSSIMTSQISRQCRRYNQGDHLAKTPSASFKRSPLIVAIHKPISIPNLMKSPFLEPPPFALMPTGSCFGSGDDYFSPQPRKESADRNAASGPTTDKGAGCGAALERWPCLVFSDGGMIAGLKAIDLAVKDASLRAECSAQGRKRLDHLQHGLDRPLPGQSTSHIYKTAGREDAFLDTGNQTGDLQEGDHGPVPSTLGLFKAQKPKSPARDRFFYKA